MDALSQCLLYMIKRCYKKKHLFIFIKKNDIIYYKVKERGKGSVK